MHCTQWDAALWTFWNPPALATIAIESQLCFALYSTMHSLGRRYAPLLRALDLTYPQYLVMLVLWERDAVSVKAIGERLLLDSGTLTPLLKRLEAAKLVLRQRNPADERMVTISVTPKGCALRDAARGLPDAMLCAMGDAPERIERLRDDLLRLRATLIAGGGDQTRGLPGSDGAAVTPDTPRSSRGRRVNQGV